VSDARAGLVTSFTGATFGAAAGTGLIGTATGALLGPTLMLVRSTINRARDTRESRAERAVETASDIIHRVNGINGIDFIQRWSISDGARFDLLVEVMEAAARTPLDVKIMALAEVLAEGLQTDGAAHEARIIAAAIADIEAPHIDLLAYLCDNPLPAKELCPPGSESMTPLGWEPSQIKKALPDLGLIVEGLVAVLAGRGLIASQGNSTWAGVSGSNQYAITELGRRCLFLLQFGSPDDVSSERRTP
jgi:hypothetical protein